MHNEYLYEVETIEPLTNSVSRIFLVPTKLARVRYVAGQYVNVIYDDKIAPLSIACAPRSNDRLEFHLYHPAYNTVAGRLLETARENRELTLTGPFGTCTASRLQPNRPIIFLARGTGFAPIKAIIEALSHGRQYPPMFLYWRMPLLNDYYLLDVLKRWQDNLASFKFQLIYKKDEKVKDQMQFDLLQKAILQDHPNLSKFQVYASGPAPLIYSSIQAFEEKGLPREFFFSDVFKQ